MVAAPGQYSVAGPKWSPDGSRVAFVAGDILVVNLADGVIANLTNHLGGASPAWSPDGGEIAFTDIVALVAETIALHHDQGASSIEEILAADAWARETCRGLRRS